jgi:hypothetical protein
MSKLKVQIKSNQTYLKFPLSPGGEGGGEGAILDFEI